jgi:hypothetical protein
MRRMNEKLNPATLVGRPVDEAREIAKRHGYIVRVITPDHTGVTLDLRGNRINLVTDGTRVTKVWFY